MEKEPEIHHIEIHPADNGGHMVEHHYKAAPASKSGAFMEHKEPERHSFGPKESKGMMNHLKEHLGLGAAAQPKTPEAAMVAAPHEPPAAEIEEDQEGE